MDGCDQTVHSVNKLTLEIFKILLCLMFYCSLNCCVTVSTHFIIFFGQSDRISKCFFFFLYGMILLCVFSISVFKCASILLINLLKVVLMLKLLTIAECINACTKIPLLISITSVFRGDQV